MTKAKYIKTKNDEIIVFSELQKHSDFRMFEPISAGFILFRTKEDFKIDCECYGESISLNLKCHYEDSFLAKRQILCLKRD